MILVSVTTVAVKARLARQVEEMARKRVARPQDWTSRWNNLVARKLHSQ